MKFKTLLLAGLVTLAASLSAAGARPAATSGISTLDTLRPALATLTNPVGRLATGGEFSGDALAVGLFAVVLVLGCWLGRCNGSGKKG